MTMNWKRNSKKYIAGILTIALAAGVCQSYGSMEVKAQEKTLPGIEKLVYDTVSSGDTFHILEIVPSKEDASIGYLIGGEEPVASGRKLSELPSPFERVNAMASLATNAGSDIVGANGLITVSPYTEIENGSRSEDLKGRFVYRGVGGRYNYVLHGATYRKLTDNEPTSEPRYARYTEMVKATELNRDLQSIIPTFSRISGSGGQLEIRLSNSSIAETKKTYGLDISMAVPTGSLTSEFNVDDYIGLEMYQKNATADSYTYLGTVVKGKDLPEEYRPTAETGQNLTTSSVQIEAGEQEEAGNQAETGGQTETGNQAETGGQAQAGSQAETGGQAQAGNQAETGGQTEAGNQAETGGQTETGNQAEAGVQAQAADQAEGMESKAYLVATTSGNDPSYKSETSATAPAMSSAKENTAAPVQTYAASGENVDNNLYLLNHGSKPARLWAVWDSVNKVYNFQSIADACFVKVTENGDYYVSNATLCEDGDYRIEDSYVENQTGSYIRVTASSVEIKTDGDAGFDRAKTYDFIGDDRENALETIRYNGGINNKEWFKKQVLNLSGEGKYEGTASVSGDVDKLKIEVTTLTLQELADLTNPEVSADKSYCGVDLDDVDLIYLSGKGDYSGDEPKNMKYAASKIAQMVFGITDDKGNRSDAARVPIIIDYGFYKKNSEAEHKAMTNLVLTLLRVSEADPDKSLAKAIVKSKSMFEKALDDTTYKDKVNTIFTSFAQTAGIEKYNDKTLGALKEFLTENVYLYDDSEGNKPYVASDYLTDIDSSKQWIYSAVKKEIQYENFLTEKSGSGGNKLAENITKASVTRYILNWYMHRVTMKSSIRVLDLEPCCDFNKTLESELQNDVVNMMGMTGIYEASAINITQMSSAEFIGKIEDLNEKYDMIYLGARVGKMNTENGVTVYNDPQMKGLIYSHVGDYYDYATKTDTENVTQARETYNARHRLQDASLDHSKTEDDDPKNKSADVYRGPGNDMNSTRYEEFCQFIEAGYPVVIADTFIKVDNNNIPVASTATLDKNSYFYKLVDFALQKDANGQYLYWQKNIFTESQLTDNTADTKLGTTLSARRSLFCNYLNLSKLSVNWVTTYGAAYPQELKYNSDQNGASNGGSLEKIDGKYQLQYIFNLQNDAAISQTGTTYDCKLFVDKNADGRFSGSDYVEGKTYTSSEEVSGLTVYIRKGDEWNKVDPIATANGNRYELRTGETYRVIRALPEEYVGVIPWKLVFYDNADRLVRTAKSGYTSVPQQNGKKTIRVLQLLSDDNRNNWNLHDEQNNSNSTFSKCINGLTDWNVVGLDQVGADGKVTPSKSIDSMTVTYLVNEKLKIGGTSDTDIQKIYQEAYNLFQQYDMLILGFGDAYRFGYTYGAYDPSKGIPSGIMANVKRNLAVGWAVRDYIESGKSILFTHDTTSYINNIESVVQWNDQGYAEANNTNYWYWGYEFNKTIRASVGLDRYGALKEYYTQRAASSTGEEQKRDQEYLNTLNSYTFDEIKEPNSDNDLMQKEGLTKYTVVRFLRSYLEDLRKTGSSTVKFPVENSLLKQAGYDNGKDPEWNHPSNLLMGDYAGSSLIATQVNDGQITQYPYQISSKELMEINNTSYKWLEISNTHYQWLQPNMELDRNGDGKNDIVVWYCISGVAGGNYKDTNIYNITPNDVVNNYYIYTMGNVTYSGAGHSKPSKKSEIKLFINTMIAAYNAGVTAPSVSFKDKSGSKIQSVYMLYDPVNHIVLDDKNNGTISVNFQADDYNILAGGQQLCVEFYKSCADDTSGAISVDGITGKVLRLKTDGEDGLKITDSNGNVILPIERNGVMNCYPITNGATYTLKYSSDEMGLFRTDTSGTILNEGAQASTIYARVYTVYDNGSKVTPCGIAELSISAEELFELD